MTQTPQLPSPHHREWEWSIGPTVMPPRGTEMAMTKNLEGASRATLSPK